MRFPIDYTLLTERCRLRYISEADIPQIFQAAQYPGFTDGMVWDPPETEAELIPHHERTVKAWEDDMAYCFTLETKDSAELIGRITIRRKEEDGIWDLGFWTHPEKQGKGFMTEAVDRMIDFGFQVLKAREVRACHARWNKASETVLRKNRMSLIRHIPEGFKKRGQWVEENLLGITRDQWRDHTAS